MTPEEYRADMLYHAALSIGKGMLEKGLITPDEFTEIRTILLQKYDPYLGSLFSESACIVSTLE